MRQEAQLVLGVNMNSLICDRIDDKAAFTAIMQDRTGSGESYSVLGNSVRSKTAKNI